MSTTNWKNTTWWPLALVSAIALQAVAAMAAEDQVDQLLRQAQQAARKGEWEAAVRFIDQAIDERSDDANLYRARGDVHAAKADHAAATADYDAAIKLAPDQADLFDRRGSEQFKQGKITASIADFDRFLALRPEQEPAHWKRGISYYYAGRFDDGCKQFEGYQNVDGNDVENAVWRFLCMARRDGIEKARADILPIRRDGRVPMMEIYALYRGDATPADVLKRATADDNVTPEQRTAQLFYAHLYLGLYYEVTGDADRAAEHLRAAEQQKIAHYMWDVAHVHAARLAEKK